MNIQSISPDNILSRSVKAIAVLAVVLIVCSVATPANAGVLFGDDVTVKLVSTNTAGMLTTMTTYDSTPNPVVVKAGNDGDFFSDHSLLIDLNSGMGSDVFAVKSVFGAGSVDGVGGTVQWILSDLNFSGGMSLLGIRILQDFGGGVIVSNLTPTSVTFTYNDVAIPLGTFFQAQFLTTVPEPASFAMFGMGAIGLLVNSIRNRRKKATL